MNFEKQPDLEDPAERIKREQLGALRSVTERLGLKILMEARFNNTHALVVEDGYGGEVHIGFPDHMDRLAATGKIRGIKMYSYGHGAWQRGIELSQ